VAQKVSARRLQALKQMQLALDLRATGASYEQISKALDPPVSAPRAWKIVQKGLEFGREKLAETSKNLIQLSLNRLNRYRMKLEPNANDPAVVNTLVKIIECEAKLTGINAPVKVAETLPDGSPVPAPDFALKNMDGKLMTLAGLRTGKWCCTAVATDTAKTIFLPDSYKARKIGAGNLRLTAPIGIHLRISENVKLPPICAFLIV
jgi:hypothetical protein